MKGKEKNKNTHDMLSARRGKVFLFGLLNSETSIRMKILTQFLK